MLRKTLALLACLLMAQPGPAAEPKVLPAQAIVEMPIGKALEVRLTSGARLRGRLDAVRNDGFELKVATKNRLESRQIAFSDVKSLKAYERSRGATIALGILAGVGVVAIIFTALLASTGFE